MERLATDTEVRAEKRRLTGKALTFGEVSPSHRERFEPGSVRLADATWLNLFHDPDRAVAWSPGGGLELRLGSDGVSLSAQVPPIPAGDKALAMIRSGTAKGLSIEFRAIRERIEGGVRVIEQAIVHGVGLVRSPSYPNAQVEARRRRVMQAVLPAETELSCDCLADSACRNVAFAQEAIAAIQAEMQAALDRAFEAVEAETRQADQLVIAGRGYESVIASARRGTLRSHVDADGRLVIEVMADDTPKALAEMDAGADVFLRPIIDQDASEFEDRGNVRRYTRPVVRAWLAKPVVDPKGWTPATVERPQTQMRECRVWL